MQETTTPNTTMMEGNQAIHHVVEDAPTSTTSTPFTLVDNAQSNGEEDLTPALPQTVAFSHDPLVAAEAAVSEALSVGATSHHHDDDQTQEMMHQGAGNSRGMRALVDKMDDLVAHMLTLRAQLVEAGPPASPNPMSFEMLVQEDLDDLQSYKSSPPSPTGICPDQLQELAVAIHRLDQQAGEDGGRSVADPALAKLTPELASLLTKHTVPQPVHFYYLRSVHGMFLSYDYHDYVKLNGHKRSSEQWTFESLGDNKVAIRSHCGGYLSAEDNEVKMQPKVEEEEIWTVRAVDEAPGKVCLLSFHGTFLSAKDDGEADLVYVCERSEWWN